MRTIDEITNALNQLDDALFNDPKRIAEECRAVVAERRLPYTHPFHRRTLQTLGRLLTHAAMTPPELVVVRDDSPFPAFCVGNTIFIGSSLDRVSLPELAFIIAHELGHLYHGDTFYLLELVAQGSSLLEITRQRLRRQELEFAADAFARDLVVEAGWPDRSADVFRRMEASDWRTDVRWNRYRRIPLVGDAVVRVQQLLEKFKYSHPPVEDRIRALRKHTAAASEVCWSPKFTELCGILSPVVPVAKVAIRPLFTSRKASGVRVLQCKAVDSRARAHSRHAYCSAQFCLPVPRC